MFKRTENHNSNIDNDNCTARIIPMFTMYIMYVKSKKIDCLSGLVHVYIFIKLKKNTNLVLKLYKLYFLLISWWYS